MKKKLLGYYDYTVVLTYCGTMCAFYGIIQSIEKNFQVALISLMAAGLFDMFDGAVAATKDRTEPEKKFGIQIDSLSDLISFGVLPGVFVYMILGGDKVAGLVSAGYTLCALIRLAYFNVLEEERQSQTSEARTSYLGIPVTTIALLLPAVYLLVVHESAMQRVSFLLTLVLVAAGFVSTLKIPKPKMIGKFCLLVLGIAEAAALITTAGW